MLVGAIAALLAASLLVANVSCADHAEPGRAAAPPSASDPQASQDALRQLAAYQKEIERLNAALAESDRHVSSATPPPLGVPAATQPQQDAHRVRTSAPCANRTQHMGAEAAACHFLEVRRPSCVVALGVACCGVWRCAEAAVA